MEQPNHSSISCSPANQHCSRSPVSTQVAEQTCRTQTTCMSPSENLAEQSDSHLFTTLAEQSQRSRAAHETYRKLPAEQHVQSDLVEHHSTPIQSRIIRSSITKQPPYSKDCMLALDTMHQCDTCGKIYALKQNLVRHVKEKHTVIEHWNCIEFGCSAKFIMRSYLNKHLGKHHNFDRLTASEKAVGAPRGDRIERYEPELEDISEDESILDLLNNIDDLKTLEPSKSDGNNNCVLDQYVVPDAENGNVAIQDLEDISDREFLCVNDDGPAVRDGNSSDGIRSCDSHGAADSGASDSETVIGDDSGMLSGIEAVNSDDGRVENSLRMSGEDSVMDTNDDMVDVGEGSVDNDDGSDKGDSDCDAGSGDYT